MRNKNDDPRGLWWATMAMVLAALSLLLGCDRALPPGGFDRTKMVTELDKERAPLMSLGNALRDGSEQMGKQIYPDELIAQLDSIEIPAPTFSGHDISKLPPPVVDGLLRYAGDLRSLAKRKKQLKALLQSAKPSVRAYFRSIKKPPVPFSVLIETTEQGPRASLVMNKTPFLAAEPWPERYTVWRLQGKQVNPLEGVRYQRGAVEGMVIPVDPKTTTGFVDQKRLIMLQKALRDTTVMVNGNTPSTGPDDAGLVEANKQLVEVIKELKLVREPA